MKTKDINGEYIVDIDGNRIDHEMFENNPLDNYASKGTKETPEEIEAYLVRRGITVPAHLKKKVAARAKAARDKEVG